MIRAKKNVFIGPWTENQSKVQLHPQKDIIDPFFINFTPPLKDYMGKRGLHSKSCKTRIRILVWEIPSILNKLPSKEESVCMSHTLLFSLSCLFSHRTVFVFYETLRTSAAEHCGKNLFWPQPCEFSVVKIWMLSPSSLCNVSTIPLFITLPSLAPNPSLTLPFLLTMSSFLHFVLQLGSIQGCTIFSILLQPQPQSIPI